MAEEIKETAAQAPAAAPAAAAAPAVRRGKRSKKQIADGVAHIHASFNLSLIHI